MIDNLSWNVFTQTGNIETYLLMKELESQDQHTQLQQASSVELEDSEDLTTS